MASITALTFAKGIPGYKPAPFQSSEFYTQRGAMAKTNGVGVASGLDIDPDFVNTAIRCFFRA